MATSSAWKECAGTDGAQRALETEPLPENLLRISARGEGDGLQEIHDDPVSLYTVPVYNVLSQGIRYRFRYSFLKCPVLSPL